MDPKHFKCPECQYTHENFNSLRIHAQKLHKISSKVLYVLAVLNGETQLCACGCGKETKFHGPKQGFMKYLRGHISRVQNNWGHNEDVLLKSQEVRRQMFKNGELEVWNKGLTKEANENVAKYGRTQSENCTHVLRNKRSSTMKNQWITHNLISLTGSSHSQWRGGTSAVHALCRSQLYLQWTYPKLKSSGFMCSKCGSSKTLEVHHDKERFAEILHKSIDTLGEHNDDFKKKSEIAEWVTDYHIKNDVSGIVLCEECHKNIHIYEDNRNVR